MRFHRGKIWRKTDGKCAYCGLPITKTAMTIDHIIAKAKFAKAIRLGKIPLFLRTATLRDVNDINNLFASCIKCNNLKQDMDLEVFRLKVFGNMRVRFWFETMLEDGKLSIYEHD